MVLTAAYSVKVSVMGTPRSTYICPLSSSANISVPFMQILVTLLDCYFLVSVSGITSIVKVDASPRSKDPSVTVGCIFLVSSSQFVEYEGFLTTESNSYPL